MKPSQPDREWKKGSAELVVLSLLDDQPRHGYDVSKLIQVRSGGALRFHVTSLYPLLHRDRENGQLFHLGRACTALRLRAPRRELLGCHDTVCAKRGRSAADPSPFSARCVLPARRPWSATYERGARSSMAACFRQRWAGDAERVRAADARAGKYRIVRDHGLSVKQAQT